MSTADSSKSGPEPKSDNETQSQSQATNGGEPKSGKPKAPRAGVVGKPPRKPRRAPPKPRQIVWHKPGDPPGVFQYDVSHVDPREPVKRHSWVSAGDPVNQPPAGSFAARVKSRLVNLGAHIREGIPPREYHAHSAGMFVRGKRHLIVAPKKTGKSLVFLVHVVRMVLAGERVVILDRENGADVYAERLGLIMDAWQLIPEQRAALEHDLLYYEYPKLKSDDPADLVRYFADELGTDLVVFDSSRKFLTDFGLKENEGDDYDLFMSYTVDPLHVAGVTTVILDNTGHADPTRGRGASSKGDLNEVLFHLEKLSPFNRDTRGRVKLVVDDSRFGDHGDWTMVIGSGVFGAWQSSTDKVAQVEQGKPEFKTSAYAVVKAAGGPQGVNKIIEAVRVQGVKISDHRARELLKKWAADPDEPLQSAPGGGYECEA